MYTLEDEPLSLLVRLELGDLCNEEEQEQDGIQVAGLPHNCREKMMQKVHGVNGRAALTHVHLIMDVVIYNRLRF